MTAGRNPSTAQEETERLLAYAALLRREERELECRVEGDSMGATLPASALVRIRLIVEPATSVGLVMAFVARARVVAHRALWIGRSQAARGYLLTAGDGNVLPDPPVKAASILGPVTAVLVEGTWSPPGPIPALPAWRRVARSLTAVLVAGVMELSVPAAEALVLALIRARRLLGTRREGRLA